MGPRDATSARGELRDRLLAIAPTQREGWLVRELERALSTALLLDAPIDPRRGFAELGLDSLAALELKRELEVQLDRPLSATLLLDHPSLNALASQLLRELTPEQAATREEPRAPVALAPKEDAPEQDALEAQIAALDESELLARITAKYERWLG